MDGEHTPESKEHNDSPTPEAHEAAHVDPAHSGSTPPASEQPAANDASATDTAAHSIKDDYKVFGIIGYIIPILFFLPMLQEHMKHDPYVRFHMNQQLILLVLWLIIDVVVQIFHSTILGPLFFVFVPLINLVYLVFIVIGIVNVVKGEQKELPLIGGFTLMK